MNEALEKVESFDGPVFRGHPDRVSEEWIRSKYKVGEGVTEPTFFSTSTSESQALQRIGPDKGNVYYAVDSKRGASIDPLSSHKGENEILFKSQTTFEVTTVEYKNDYGGYWLVEMIEK